MSDSVTIDHADDERFLATDHLVWFEEPGSLPTRDQLVGVPPGQRFAADRPGSEPGTYPGIYAVRPMQLSVPAASGGRLVPMAGLTWVGVHPDHRRRGVLNAMIRHHLEQTLREGLALSCLHASEPVIYGRYGYGLASQTATLSVSRGATFTAPGLDEAMKSLETRLATETGHDLVTRVMECEQRVGASCRARSWVPRATTRPCCARPPNSSATRSHVGCCSPAVTVSTSGSPPSVAPTSGSTTVPTARSRWPR